MLGKKRENTTNGKHDKSDKKRKQSNAEESGNEDKGHYLRKASESKHELENFGLSTEVAQKLREREINSLFEVQQKVFFPVFNGENVIVASLTGSGKTLSFILPTIERMKAKNRFSQTDPVAIVLAPTRELAIQIANEFNTLTNKSKSAGFFYKVLAVYGGTDIWEQKAQLKKGVDIIVGTPGRVLDLINRGDLKLGNMRMGILDEADKMLEMGFQEPIEEIFDNIYKERSKLQVCLFSATIHKWVVDVSKKIMNHKEHTFVNLVKDLKGRCPVGVQHLAVNCLKSEKLTTIADLSKYYIIYIKFVLL